MSDSEQQPPTPGVDEELEERRVAAANGVEGSDDDEQLEVADEQDDDDDDDDVHTARRRGKPEARTNGAVDDDVDEDGDGDLFGDDDDDDVTAERPAKRQLDDQELDSGDDEGRADRVPDEEEDQDAEMLQRVTMDIELPRQSGPEPSDGEMYTMKVPDFLSVEPTAFTFQGFQPPTTDHHSRGPPSEAFSPFKTALTTIRWRRSPNNPSELQSNARINRWSDGSLTLQLASDPTTQYEMVGNPLAPSQLNPKKPTPVSVQADQRDQYGGPVGDGKYRQSRDTFTYLVTPVVTQDVLRVTNKLTASLVVKHTGDTTDDAIVNLQNSLAAAANATKVNGASGIELVQVTEDPELGRKRAEQAEREKERARKRRENAELKTAERAGRVMGRHGLSSNRYGGAGLTVGGLEDGELGTTMGGNRGRAATRPRKVRQRRNSEYSSEEENGRGRFRAGNEEYEVDDFVAASDEEEEIVDDDDDPDDGIVESPRRGQRSPKRRASDDDDEEEEDEDADGEPDEEVTAHKAKRARRVVDEDEDEDE